jgi:hypothetical protein
VILFLDFDGVMHPFFPRADRSDDENRYLSYLPRLEAVLRDHSEVRIVVASDWRLRHSFDELRAFFSPDISARVIGTTEPVRPEHRSEPGQRQRQVEAYLRVNNLVGLPWVALDDDVENYLPGASVVICDDGFRDAEDAALRALLKSAGRR